MAGPGGIWERNMTISYKLEKFEGPLVTSNRKNGGKEQ